MGNPISIEFVANKGRFVGDVRSMVDEIGSLFAGSMTQAASKVETAIGRIETQLKSLGKINVFDFASGFADVNANLSKIVASLQSGIQPQLATMRKGLASVKDEAVQLAAAMAQVNAAGGGGAGGGGGGLRAGKKILGRMTPTGAGQTLYSDDGIRTTTQFSGKMGKIGQQTTITDSEGNAVVTAIRISTQNLAEIAAVNEQIQAFIKAGDYKKISKSGQTRIDTKGRTIQSSQYINPSGSIGSYTYGAQTGASFTAGPPEYTIAGVKSKADFEAYVRKVVAGPASGSFAQELGDPFVAAITTAGKQMAQKYLTPNGQIATHNLTTGNVNVSAPQIATLPGADGDMSKVYGVLADRASNLGFSKISEDLKQVDHNTAQWVETWSNAAGRMLTITKDETGKARLAQLKAPAVTTDMANSEDARIRSILAGGNFTLQSSSEQGKAGSSMLAQVFKDALSGETFKAILNQGTGKYVSSSQSTPGQSPMDKALDDMAAVIKAKGDLLAQGFSETTESVKTFDGQAVQTITTWTAANGAVAKLNESTGAFTQKHPADTSALIAALTKQNQAFLTSKGLKQTGTQYTTGADGTTQQVNEYKNAVTGATATVNQSLQTMQANVPVTTFWNNLTSMASDFWGKMTVAPKAVLAPLSAVVEATKSVSVAFLRMSGVIYTLKNIWSGFDALVVSPIKRFGNGILEATEQYREFEIAISGVTGGMEKSRQVQDAVSQAWEKLPTRMKDVQDIARQMAFVGPLTSQIASGTVKDIEKNVEDYGKLVAKLSLLNPQQGTEGVLVALREAISGGEFRSLRFRLDVSPQQIAHSIGKDLSELVGNPALTQEALQKFADQFIGDQAIGQMGNLFSVRVGKLYDSIRHGLAKIGDSGIFDAVTDKFGQMSKQLFKYFESDDFSQYGQRISNALVKIFDNVVKAIDQFVRGITGATDQESTVGAFVERLTKLFEILADKSDGLPGMFKGFAEGVNSIVGVLRTLIETLSAVAEAAYNMFPDSAKQAPRNYGAVNDQVQKIMGKYGLQGGSVTSLIKSPPGKEEEWFDWDAVRKDLGMQPRGTPFIEYDLPDQLRWDKTPTYNKETGQMEGQYAISEKQKQMNDIMSKVAWIKGIDGETRIANPAMIERLMQAQGFNQIAGPPASAAKVIPNAAASSLYNLLREEGINLGFSNYSSFNAAFSPRHQDPIGSAQPKSYAINPYETNFKAQTLSLAQGYGGLGDTAFDAKLPLNVMVNKMNSMMGQRFAPNAEHAGLGGIFDAMATQYQKSANQLTQDLQKLQQFSDDLEEEGFFNESDDVKHLMGKVSARMTDLPKEYQDAVDAMKAASIQGAQQYGQGIIELTKDLPPQARQAFVNQVIEGTTALGLAVAKGLNIPPEQIRKVMGLDDPKMPLYAKNRILSENFSAGEAAFAERAKYGDIAGTPSGQQIVDHIANRPSGFAQNPTEIAQAQVASLQNQLPTYVKTYDAAVQNLQSANGEFNKSLALRDMETAKSNLAAISARLTEMKEKADLVTAAWRDFGKAVEDSMTKGMSDAIYNLITRTGTLKDALIGFAQSIARAWSDMVAKIAMQKILGNDANAAGGSGGLAALFAAFGGSKGTSAAAPSALPETTTPLMISEGAANGAVWHGGFTPLAAFSNGGIVNRPVVGIVGEGKYPGEAMVPLPDGRSIPVTMNGGGGGGGGNIFIIASMEDAVRNGFRAHKDDIVSIAVADVKKGGKLAQTIKRRSTGK